ncbi:Zinc ABC transporter, permease protein ZnuB [Citrifermentans bremense]|uniref:Zinc ABC transporter, permease protein ZnuB n=1 Tax=Citrifermentans bremense TaxID=60035 RepID=A0A6S6M2X5_9BACT|nr:metal ABC transporter permease [Citrifermentans bremense]BCG48702.1 Zinc ABC transporter, permease protein ZnuB [Citrifermentans bremense]
MLITEMLSYGFMQRALIGGSLIAILCSVLGVFLVLRRLSLIGDGLAHVTFGSVALALLFRLQSVYLTLAIIPVVLASSMGILKLAQKARIYGDAAIGIVSAIGIATGVMLASVAGGFNVDLFSYLFGNILSISTSELVIAALLFVIVIASVVMFYNELFASTFDEDLAKSSGLNTERINSVLVLMTALTVVLAMKVVGIMLISALLIIPAVSALQIAKGFKAAIVTAAVIGVVTVIVGISLSFALNLPAGATIVLVNFLVLLGAFGGRTLRGHK